MIKFFTATNRVYPTGPDELKDVQIVCSPVGHIAIKCPAVTTIVIDAADSLHLKSFVLEAPDAEIVIQCPIRTSEIFQLTAKRIIFVSTANINAASTININVENLETENGSSLSFSSNDTSSTFKVNHLCNNGDVVINGDLSGNIARLDGTGTNDIHLRKTAPSDRRHGFAL